MFPLLATKGIWDWGRPFGHTVHQWETVEGHNHVFRELETMNWSYMLHGFVCGPVRLDLLLRFSVIPDEASCITAPAGASYPLLSRRENFDVADNTRQLRAHNKSWPLPNTKTQSNSLLHTNVCTSICVCVCVCVCVSSVAFYFHESSWTFKCWLHPKENWNTNGINHKWFGKWETNVV